MNEEMSEKMNDYFEMMALPTIFRKRIEVIYNFYNEICIEPIQDLFISEYITEDKSRELESIWFFSKNFLMEARNFLKEDDFDMDLSYYGVTHIRIKKKDYDFIKATNKSRMSLLLAFDTSSAIFKASEENCDSLKNIFIKYFKPS